MIHTQPGGWILETDRTAYALGLNAAGLLTHRYWGERLPYPEDYPEAVNPGAWGPFNNPSHLTPEEFPGYSDMKYIEPCLKVTFADGVRDVDLRFGGADSDSETLRVYLHDSVYPLHLTLEYRVHSAADLIERRATLTNAGDAPVRIERMLSALWHFPGAHWRLTYLTGRWFDETHVRREALQEGVKVLESRRLTSGHHFQPYFALDRGQTTEDHGDVWYGLLEWSGSWKLTAEVSNFHQTRVGIGLNDWDFAWRLNPGDAFTTPAAIAGFTRRGFGAASRNLHNFVRDSVLPHPPDVHKVFYNSWEATLFDVEAESQYALAVTAARMGCELFMLDDGWYHERFNQDSGLGDWWPDARKFPDGLEVFISRVNALGMDFGLWIEPENVNPDSDLYRAHPDWVIHFPTRERRLGRSALTLNLGRVDVQEYLIESLDRLLAAYNIACVKWDMNRNISEAGWPDAPGEPQELWVRYVHGLYRVWDTLRERHPQVIFHSCSGGGGRSDLGMLRRADLIWISDNSAASSRLAIQDGYLHMFPACTMQTWVTDQQQELPLEFRFHAAMTGILGVGADIRRWSENDIQTATACIARYKTIRPLVQSGDCYRLHPADDRGFSALQFVSKDRGEAVLFAFRTHTAQHEPSLRLRLCGLDSESRYTVEGFPGVRSGAAWMVQGEVGRRKKRLHNFESTIRRIQRVETPAGPDVVDHILITEQGE